VRTASLRRPGPVPTAVQTVAAVQAGTTTARAAVHASLDRIAAVDGLLGAYQVVRAERALAEADEVDRRRTWRPWPRLAPDQPR
jgi:amidase